MNAAPLVSVITVCFNAADTIRRTVVSVAQQTYAPVEYIVVDGGSTDGTLDIVRQYAPPKTRVISGPDCGISDAFNKGVAAATGEYIQFINADDALAPDKVERSVELFRKRPDAGFVFGDVLKEHPDGTVERVAGDPHYRRRLRYVMTRVNHPTMMVPRSLFGEVGGFDTVWKVAMDYDWLLRLEARSIHGVYSPEIIVIMGAGGVSDAQRFKAFRECRDISIRHGLAPLSAYAYQGARIMKHLVLRSFGRRT